MEKEQLISNIKEALKSIGFILDEKFLAGEFERDPQRYALLISYISFSKENTYPFFKLTHLVPHLPGRGMYPTPNTDRECYELTLFTEPKVVKSSIKYYLDNPPKDKEDILFNSQPITDYLVINSLNKQYRGDYFKTEIEEYKYKYRNGIFYGEIKEVLDIKQDNNGKKYLWVYSPNEPYNSNSIGGGFYKFYPYENCSKIISHEEYIKRL
jgi:hypothetical protein